MLSQLLQPLGTSEARKQERRDRLDGELSLLQWLRTTAVLVRLWACIRGAIWR
jgi:hypothetical protein